MAKIQSVNIFIRIYLPIVTTLLKHQPNKKAIKPVLMNLSKNNQIKKQLMILLMVTKIKINWIPISHFIKDYILRFKAYFHIFAHYIDRKRNTWAIPRGSSIVNQHSFFCPYSKIEYTLWVFVANKVHIIKSYMWNKYSQCK